MAEEQGNQKQSEAAAGNAKKRQAAERVRLFSPSPSPCPRLRDSSFAAFQRLSALH